MTWRTRLADMLGAELRHLQGEQVATAIDGGLGIAAVAAIAAQPRGPARAVEAARWIRIAQERGVETIATPITGGMTDDELDAVVEWHMALRRAEAA